MGKLTRIGELQVHEDLGQQRGEWQLERIGRIVFPCILLAALFGLFGGGVLSSRTAGDSRAGFWAEYNRFVRRHSNETVKFLIRSEHIREGAIELSLDQRFLDAGQKQQFVPTPQRVTARGDRQLFLFNAEPSEDPIELVFSFEPDEVGSRTITAELNGGHPMTFSQFVYP